MVDVSGHMGAQHFVLHEEEEAFADWMNRALSKDKHVAHHLPLAVRSVPYHRRPKFFLHTAKLPPRRRN